MTDLAIAALRETIAAMLAANGQAGPLGDQESLFLSGRLDSLAAAELMTILERDYGIDLADADFDITQLDTLALIEGLARRQAA